MPNPGGTAWHGVAAEAAQQRAYSDRMKVVGVADELHMAAMVARNGAGELTAAKQQVLSIVGDARAAGFAVGDDISVSYAPGSGALASARMSQAQAFNSQIRTAVTTLAAIDLEVARKINSAANGVSALTFPESPPVGPTPEQPKDPDAQSLSVRNAEDVHKVVDPLPQGRQPHVKVLPNSAAVRGLFEELTGNSVPAPPSSYPGESRVLEDGTRISYRDGSKSGGATIDIVYPDGTSAKVHVEEFPRQPNPAPLPAPAPAPIAVPSPDPLPVPSLPSPAVGAPPVAPEDVSVIGVIGGIGIGILAGIGELGKWVLSP